MNSSGQTQPLAKVIYAILLIPRYAILVVVTAYAFLVLIGWLQNIRFFRYVLRSPAFTTFDAFSYLFGLKGLGTSTTVTSTYLIIVIAFLTGINIAILTYYLKQRIALEKSIGITLAGTLIALVGVGCASCGSVILTSLFGLVVTTSIIGLLPFRGLEFLLFAVILVSFSIYAVAKKIQQPIVC